jgi:hypothetical protein
MRISYRAEQSRAANMVPQISRNQYIEATHTLLSLKGQRLKTKAT